MTSTSSTNQNLQQGLTNPKYLRVLNNSYPTKRKDSKGMQAKGKLEARITFVEKLTTSGSLLSTV